MVTVKTVNGGGPVWLRVGTQGPGWGIGVGIGAGGSGRYHCEASQCPVTAHSLRRNVDPPVWYDTDVKLFEIQRV